MDLIIKHIPPEYLSLKINYCRQQLAELPEVLKNGNDAAINEYNRIASLVETWDKRPDMLDKLDITEEEWKKMLAFKKGLC